MQIAEGLIPALLPQGEQWVTQALGAALAYDPNTVKWVQGALNSFLHTNLTVDGIWGPKTKAAVLQAESQLGIAPNGALSNTLISALTSFLAGAKV